MGYQYDLVVIGGGSGGITAAKEAASRGIRTLLIEKNRLGGGALWYGTVPSKALVAVSRRIDDIRTAHELGLPQPDVHPDFLRIMQRVRSVQDTLDPVFSEQALRETGCTTQFGAAQFIDPHTITVDGRSITFRYAIIATGSMPIIPDIPGLGEAGCITSQEIGQLRVLPKRIAVIGAGSFGAEMGQVFRRLGAEVTIIGRHGLLPKENTRHVKLVEEQFAKEGITLITGEARSVRKEKEKIITVSTASGEQEVICDDILLAVGRAPNIKTIGLEKAGVRSSDAGIAVDALLRTNVKHIYAIGDVIGGPLYGHMAKAQAQTVVHNLTHLSKEERKTVIPWVTYTDPELAQVGMTEHDAMARRVDHDVLTHTFQTNERALCDNRTAGSIRVIVAKDGKLLGASIAGNGAAEVIQEYVFALQHGMRIQDIAATVHAYPSYSGGSWLIAGDFLHRRKGLLERIFGRR